MTPTGLGYSIATPGGIVTNQVKKIFLSIVCNFNLFCFTIFFILILLKQSLFVLRVGPYVRKGYLLSLIHAC